MRQYGALLVSLVLAGCAPPKAAATNIVPEAKAAPSAGSSGGGGQVRVIGALRALMHEGKTGPLVALSSVVPGPHAYAVGALSDLRGEVTLVDDEIWLAYPNDDGTARVAEVRESDETAALLVAANVPAWRRIPIAAEIRAERLDDELEQLARAHGVDTNRAIPLVIEGEFADLGWHVIDGRKMAVATTHDEHASAVVRGSVPRASGRLVGFFSTHHQGVFTHMGKKSHFHVVMPKEHLSGHVESVAILAGATLNVPQ